MPRWNTKELQQCFSDLGRVETLGQGGSFDTETILIYPDGTSDYIRVTGFTPGEEVYSPSYVENLTDVVVRNGGSDSSGGLQTKDENVGICYGRVVARLSKMGFATYCHHDELF